MVPFTDQQRLFLVESEQIYRAWEAAVRQHAQYRYGMKWLKSGGKAYLVRLADARGNGRSLGPRNAQTEAVYAAFNEGKSRSLERVKSLTARLREQARLNRAIGIGRLPTVIGEILGALNVAGVGADFRVIGTHAIFGYEAMAGVQCRMELLASGDVDRLYDQRKHLSLVSKRLDGSGLMGVLKRVDKSFEPAGKGAFRAVNGDGFMVDLIGQTLAMHRPASTTFAADDLVLAEVPSLEWLANAPRVEAVAIGANGTPAHVALRSAGVRHAQGMAVQTARPRTGQEAARFQSGGDGGRDRRQSFAAVPVRRPGDEVFAGGPAEAGGAGYRTGQRRPFAGPRLLTEIAAQVSGAPAVIAEGIPAIAHGCRTT